MPVCDVRPDRAAAAACARGRGRRACRAASRTVARHWLIARRRADAPAVPRHTAARAAARRHPDRLPQSRPRAGAARAACRAGRTPRRRPCARRRRHRPARASSASDARGWRMRAAPRPRRSADARPAGDASRAPRRRRRAAAAPASAATAALTACRPSRRARAARPARRRRPLASSRGGNALASRRWPLPTASATRSARAAHASSLGGAAAAARRQRLDRRRAHRRCRNRSAAARAVVGVRCRRRAASAVDRGARQVVIGVADQRCGQRHGRGGVEHAECVAARRCARAVRRSLAARSRQRVDRGATVPRSPDCRRRNTGPTGRHRPGPSSSAAFGAGAVRRPQGVRGGGAVARRFVARARQQRRAARAGPPATGSCSMAARRTSSCGSSRARRRCRRRIRRSRNSRRPCIAHSRTRGSASASRARICARGVLGADRVDRGDRRLAHRGVRRGANSGSSALERARVAEAASAPPRSRSSRRRRSEQRRSAPARPGGRRGGRAAPRPRAARRDRRHPDALDQRIDRGAADRRDRLGRRGACDAAARRAAPTARSIAVAAHPAEHRDERRQRRPRAAARRRASAPTPSGRDRPRGPASTMCAPAPYRLLVAGVNPVERGGHRAGLALAAR